MKILIIIFLIFNFILGVRILTDIKRLESDWLEYLECNDLPAKINHHHHK